MNHHRQILLLFHILLAVALFPTCYVIYNFRFSVDKIRRAFIAFLPAALLIVLSRVFPRAISLIIATFFTFSIFGAALVACIAAFYGTKWLRSLSTDYSMLKSTTKSRALSRAVIAEDFLRFKTGWFRQRYVLWLRYHVIAPLGEWPEGRPNISDDKASTMLAQIDERWLGLDN